MPINLYSKDSVDDLLDEKLSISSLSNAATVTLNAGVPTAGQALTYDGTDLIWATVSGGGLTISTLSNAATATLNAGVPSSGQALVFDGTDLAWQYPTVTWGAIGGTLSTQTDLQGELDLKAPLSSPAFVGTTTFIGAGGTVSLNDQALDMSASTAGGHIIVGTSGVTFSDSTTQTTAATEDVMTANAIAANVNYLNGSTGTWVGNGLPTIAGLIGWGVYNVTDGLIAYSYSSGSSFYLASAISTSNNTVQVSGSNSSFYIA